ncbi:Crp/Fnr family transcriptional regulator [Halomicronema sp. CCY15110]|uniref:Crp/Fnr family transcriptional regulator n=1 Tax=Halomicronema sp. CCY15110 TaxID=2767773 RepID=UPI00194F0BD7|nr:Crp/Fnr family transcriptional regulator [Halomicronema sp. CCY15110]
MLTSVDRLLFVREVPIFNELRDDFLIRLVSIMDELSFPERHTILTEGHEGRALYIVVKGQVKVHRENGQTLAELDAGACFGEMSLFDAEPRSASVTTLEECDCLILTQNQLYEAIDETPGIAINIIRLLSRRIRELNKDLQEKRATPEPQRESDFTYNPGEVPGRQRQTAMADNGAYALVEENAGFPYGSFPH